MTDGFIQVLQLISFLKIKISNVSVDNNSHFT